jgi:hypothetical protein
MISSLPLLSVPVKNTRTVHAATHSSLTSKYWHPVEYMRKNQVPKTRNETNVQEMAALEALSKQTSSAHKSLAGSLSSSLLISCPRVGLRDHVPTLTPMAIGQKQGEETLMKMKRNVQIFRTPFDPN